MTLVDACHIALECGLHTVGEAVFNIELHAMSIFSYEDIRRELDQLYQEVGSIPSSKKILEQFPELGDNDEESEDL